MDRKTKCISNGEKVAEWMTNTKFDSLPLNAIISHKETKAVIPNFKNGKKLSPGKIPNEQINNGVWWTNHGLSHHLTI